MVSDCSTTKIAQVVRDYEGVKRKHAIGEMVKAGEVREFSEADARSLLHRGKARLAVQAATTVQPDAPAHDDFEVTAVAVQDVVGSADQEKPSRRRSKRGE